MAEFGNTFVQGRMDKDSDERLIQPGTYRNALNMTVDTSEGSNVGAGQNSLGNTKIGDLATVTGRSTANCRNIGTVKYERDNLIYYLIAGDTFDGIFEYNGINNTITRVLQSNKATPPTASKLNFSHDYVVTGINYINGFLYWTDNFNEPRKIKVSRAKSYNIDDARMLDDLKVILAPPLVGPKIFLSIDSNNSQSNNIEEKFIYFSYRYKYIDNQYSAMSPFSGVGFNPSTYNFDFLAGNNASMKNKYNQADIHFNTGGLNVIEVQLLMRDTRNSNISIIESFNKSKLGYADFTSQSFRFKNNKIYTVLTPDQVNRIFDNVPLLAECQTIAGNRLVYGNYTQFFDITRSNGDAIKIDLSLSNIPESTPVNTPIQTFRSDRDYEVGITYLDDYGRTTTVLTSENNTTYVSPANSITGNSLKLQIKNEPPSWATSYRLVIKQSKGKYYNIFPVLFYKQGNYRYFLINESDRDKVKIGGYVIFKADASGPTLSNKKYKVLELKNQEADFISGSSNFELPGLYFKIKVDSQNEINSSGTFSYNSTGIGIGLTDRVLSYKVPPAIVNPELEKYMENPIHYGTGNGGIIQLNVTNYLYTYDSRVIVEIDGIGTFKYYMSGDMATSGGLISDDPIIKASGVSMSIGSNISLYPVSGTTNVNFCQILFTSTGTVGDRWVLNCRGASNNGNNVNLGRTAIVPGENWTGSPAGQTVTDIAIKVGAVITLNIKEDTYNPNTQAGIQVFSPSPANYVNLEEWWYESGACNEFIYIDTTGSNIGSKNVRFRRGYGWTLVSASNSDFDANTILTGNTTGGDSLIYPVRMLIESSVEPNNYSVPGDEGPYGLTNYDQSKIVVEFSIKQQDTTTICETEPEDNDSEIFHELIGTRPILNGLHKVLWAYEDFTAPSYAAGKTNLGQAVAPTVPTSASIPHTFNVGETIYVTASNQAYVPNGVYTILQVPDAYNIVIDFPFPGPGPVTPGGVSYSITDVDQSNYSTSPAIIKINNPNTINSDFNGWSFGNGLESNRLLDDWNERVIEYSVRSNAVVEGYKRKISENALCYSEIFGINTSIDRLNEFNLSIANFKYLAKEFGPIKKIHARDTDLLVFQYDKISSVLYGKNLLSDSVGGGQIVSIPEVLGTQIALPYENGISSNPESFALWGEDIFCTDARRGTVLNIRGNQIQEINPGMKDFFRDLMRDNPNKQKLGAYDPHQNHYVLASNDNSSIPCKLTLSRDSLNVSKVAGTLLHFLFTIISDLEWTVSLENLGYGTNWVSNFATTGYGTQDISAVIAANNTGANRLIGFNVTYCGDKPVQFTLTQSRAGHGTVVVLVNNFNSTAKVN